MVLYKTRGALGISSLVQNTAYFLSSVLSKWLPGFVFIHLQGLVMAWAAAAVRHPSAIPAIVRETGRFRMTHSGSHCSGDLETGCILQMNLEIYIKQVASFSRRLEEEVEWVSDNPGFTFLMVTCLIFKKHLIRKWELCVPIKVKESIYNWIKSLRIYKCLLLKLSFGPFIF